MTREQREYLEGILTILERLVPGAREYVLAVVSDYAEMLRQRDWAEIIETIERAANLPAWLFRTKAWQRAARAWMLVKLVALLKAAGGMWSIARSDIGELFDDLENAYEDPLLGEEYLEAELIEALLMRRPISRAVLRIDQAFAHPSSGAWAPRHFTDPRRHSPFNFLYLIHAMRPLTSVPRGSDESFRELQCTIGAFLSPNRSNRSLLDLRAAEMFFTRPDLLCNEILSCSVIGNTHVRTYGDASFGFVLHAPLGTVLAASSTDLSASTVQNRARPSTTIIFGHVRRMHAQLDLVEGLTSFLSPTGRIDSPRRILRKSTGHNEVVVLGHNGSRRVRPCAIFIKVTPNGELWQSFVDDDRTFGLSFHISGCARRLRIPIIPIVDARGTGSGFRFVAWHQLATQPLSLSAPTLRSLRLPSVSLSRSPLSFPRSTAARTPSLRSQGIVALRPSGGLVQSGGFIEVTAPRGSVVHTLEATLRTGAVRFDFILPRNHTTDDVFRVFSPVFREYFDRRRQRTGSLAITDVTSSSSSRGLVATVQETREDELMRRLLELIAQLLRTARPGNAPRVATGMLTWTDL